MARKASDLETALIANFRTIIRAYARATGYSQVRISKDLYGSAHFLSRFLTGKQSVSIWKYGKMYERLVAVWPEGLAWPMCPIIVMRGPANKVKNATLSPRKSAAA
jgi:hypothetical protein